MGEQAGDEILLDLDLLKEWSILPKNFPLSMDKSERETKVQKVTIKDTRLKLVEITEKKGSVRTKMKFNELQEESNDSSEQMEKLRETLLKE